jgi:hypothetical protein
MGVKTSLLSTVVVLCAAVLSSGCGVLGPSAELKAAAAALLSASETCLLDVRDRRMKYEQSKNCNSLGVLSGQYINAGGLRPDTPPEVEISFERARVQAWTALALSASGGEASRIW